ncbi:unnamed protein product [Clonostachys chloroleuca]|uniref:Alcohol dehydrogenase-like C-terminal domain-containing protein n=1 Tax=Clonostachys chloroleuca TaxID=1926264 RepID=A0AA35MBA0_9HYPO|nr:unnamed protein product [Clonostachys chloroleuca]
MKSPLNAKNLFSEISGRQIEATSIGIANCFRVVVLSRTSSKEADARELGAHHFICSESADVAAEVNKLGAAKLIIVTAPNSNVEQYTKCLQWQGKIVILASPPNLVLHLWLARWESHGLRGDN